MKTRRFHDPVYLGDPINLLRIFNDKEVDEIVVLDIAATTEGREPNFRLLAEMASECFMPLAYGGGLRSVDQMGRLLASGFEKVVLNTVAAEQPDVVRAAADAFGSSSVVVSIDVRRRMLGGYRVVTRSGTTEVKGDPAEYAERMQALGAGELLITAVDRDGTMEGYDLELIRRVTRAVDVPVVAAGGAGTVADLGRAVVEGGASAAAAGSMFVFQGPHRAVLVTFPPRRELEALFGPAAAGTHSVLS